MSQLQFRTIRRHGASALSRGRAAVERVIAPGTHELRDQPEFANSEVARLRRLVKKERKAVEQLKQELRATRSSLIDRLAVTMPGRDLVTAERLPGRFAIPRVSLDRSLSSMGRRYLWCAAGSVVPHQNGRVTTGTADAAYEALIDRSECRFG